MAAVSHANLQTSPRHIDTFTDSDPNEIHVVPNVTSQPIPDFWRLLQWQLEARCQLETPGRLTVPQGQAAWK